MKLFVGLGNPGAEYEATRHNIGFMAIDHLADQLGIEIKKSKFQALYGEAVIDGEKVVLLKPMTYMNLSGQSLRQAVDWYKPSMDDLVVLYDEMDLPLGKLRLRVKGSAGGHNGIKSIIQHLHTENFMRMRMGIGRPAEKGGERVISHVLSPFRKEELPIVNNLVDRAAQAAKCILKDGFMLAMNRFNT